MAILDDAKQKNHEAEIEYRLAINLLLATILCQFEYKINIHFGFLVFLLGNFSFYILRLFAFKLSIDQSYLQNFIDTKYVWGHDYGKFILFFKTFSSLPGYYTAKISNISFYIIK